MQKTRPVIILAAMASTGKTTVAKAIAQKFKLKFYDGGDVLKMIAKEAGYRVTRSKGWWDTPDGMAFLKHRTSDPNFDYKLDKKFLELAKKGGVVFTSWTLPWLWPHGIKIWLAASTNARAARMAARDRVPFETALAAIRERDRKNKELYRRLYGIALGTDFRPFDIIIDTEQLSAKQVTALATKRIRELLERGCDEAGSHSRNKHLNKVRAQISKHGVR